MSFSWLIIPDFLLGHLNPFFSIAAQVAMKRMFLGWCICSSTQVENNQKQANKRDIEMTENFKWKNFQTYLVLRESTAEMIC